MFTVPSEAAGCRPSVIQPGVVLGLYRILHRIFTQDFTQDFYTGFYTGLRILHMIKDFTGFTQD